MKIDERRGVCIQNVCLSEKPVDRSIAAALSSSEAMSSSHPPSLTIQLPGRRQFHR